MAPEGNVFKTLVNGLVAMAKNVGIDYLSVIIVRELFLN